MQNLGGQTECIMGNSKIENITISFSTNYERYFWCARFHSNGQLFTAKVLFKGSVTKYGRNI